jgi:Cft2 family RNA processing exonuclease
MDASTTRMQVRTLGQGVLLPELKLALDAAAPGYASVVSHGHGDHVPWDAQGTVLASPETVDVLARRAPLLRADSLPWGEEVRVGDARVTLRPAGHILGSACVHVRAPDGSTLLYTGDTKTREGLTCPRGEFPEADELVVESTFGLPIYRFPETAELQRRAVEFARATIEAGEVPVFLGYALGKAQEILAILTRGGVPTVAHGAVWGMCAIYERHGVAFPTTRPYEPGKVERAALVVPDSFREHPMVTKLDARLAYCSGWARLSKSRVQLDVDCLLPLSDHADFPGLLDIVDRVRPRKVYANHGYADTFARLVEKQRGIDAVPLVVGHTDEDAAAPTGLRERDAR